MFKLKKRILSLGLVMALCMTMSMPVMAAGRRCPSCGSTNTEYGDDIVEYQKMDTPCIHGTGGRDDVEFLVHYPTYVCNDCGHTTVLPESYREEMRRICRYA